MSNKDFSFNALNASAYYFETGSYFDDLLPSQRQYIIEVPKIPGFTQLSKGFESREIPVTGVLYASNEATLLTRIESLRGFLYYEVDKQLIFNDKTDRFYLAQHLEKIKMEKRGGGIFAPLQLIFTCNDPFGYAVTPDTITKTNVVTDGYQFTVTNNGQTYAWPIITITFHQPQTHIYMLNNNINDCRFDISKAFNTNDVLLIDSKTERITLNNVYSPAGFGDGGSALAEFIILRGGIATLGDNLLEIGTDDATMNVSINVWFRKTYL